MSEIGSNKVRDYVRQLPPPARSRLLVELERLHLLGEDVKGTEALLAGLRAEFRKGGQQAHGRVKSPSRYFFQPLEPMLVDHAPDQANVGQIARGSLAAIWEWISQVLLPAMARDYDAQMRPVILAEKQNEAEQLAAAFQAKVTKCLEGALATADGVERTRRELATFTSSRGAFTDVAKMLSVLQAREALAKFAAALPSKVGALEGRLLAKIRSRLDALSSRHFDAMPFALTILLKRIETPWQLIRLATKIADTKDAADVAAAPYAISVSMVLDHLGDKRLELCQALKDDRILIAKNILIEIYDIERALRARIDQLDKSAWGRRLTELVKMVAADLEPELHKLPNNLHHVRSSRTLHHDDTIAGRLAYLIRKGRGAAIDGVLYCRKLITVRVGGHPARS